jgi:lathosterol oxidase
MDVPSNLIQTLLLALGVLAVVYYILPAGIFYWRFYIRNHHSYNKIQPSRPSRKQINREVRLSLLSVCIFAIMVTFTVAMFQQGHTRLYLEFSKYGYLYTLISPFILVIIHDIYFYWTHRWLHTKTMFSKVHRVHHQSISPTPWAIYAFHPIEAFIQIAIYSIIVFILPLHPVVLALVFFYSAIANAGGHCGFEFTPGSWKNHWLFRYNNSVSHHDLHHSAFTVNYSLYFNIWDRLMGTMKES